MASYCWPLRCLPGPGLALAVPRSGGLSIGSHRGGKLAFRMMSGFDGHARWNRARCSRARCTSGSHRHHCLLVSLAWRASRNRGGAPQAAWAGRLSVA